MSKKEIITALAEIKDFTTSYEEEPGRKCKKFFEIIHHIRVSVQIITELLVRIEKLEEEISNLKIK